MLLVGDIGGTKTDLAVFAPPADPRRPLVRAEFPSAGYPSLVAIVRSRLVCRYLRRRGGESRAQVLSTGGVYLAGGIPQRVLPALVDGRFMRAFVAKGRLADVIGRMPVHVILRRAALIGSARFGMDLAAAESGG